MYRDREYKSIFDRVEELVKDGVGNRAMKTILKREFPSMEISGKLIKTLRSV